MILPPSELLVLTVTEWVPTAQVQIPLQVQAGSAPQGALSAVGPQQALAGITHPPQPRLLAHPQGTSQKSHQTAGLVLTIWVPGVV